MKKNTPQRKIKKSKEDPQGLGLIKDPIISSVMFQLASFEWGLKQNELTLILDKTKDSNKGKGIRWALKILQNEQNKIVITERTKGHDVQIINKEDIEKIKFKTDTSKTKELEKAIIGTTDSFATRYKFSKSPAWQQPIDFIISEFEKTAQEHEKKAYKNLKEYLFEYQLGLIQAFSLNPTYPYTEKDYELSIENLNEIEKKVKLEQQNCKTEQEKEYVTEQFNELSYLRESTETHKAFMLERIKKYQEDQKELMQRQREEKFTYARWTRVQLEGYLLDTYNRLVSERRKWKEQGLISNVFSKTYSDPKLTQTLLEVRTNCETALGMIIELEEKWYIEENRLLEWVVNGIRNYTVPYTKEEQEGENELQKAEEKSKEIRFNLEQTKIKREEQKKGNLNA